MVPWFKPLYWHKDCLKLNVAAAVTLTVYLSVVAAAPKMDAAGVTLANHV